MAYFTFNTNIPLPRTAEELQDRIKSLFAIRTELDREIESLMGVKAEAAKPYHCVRCDYKWKSRLAHRPKMCPRCRIKKFDRPPLYTYEEKIARKQEQLTRDRAIEELPKEVPIVIPAPMPHSVLTRQVYVESAVPRVSVEADSIQNVMLTPPPEPDRPLSLRERLAQMKSQPIQQFEPTPEPEPVIIEQETEDELMEAINGDEEQA